MEKLKSIPDIFLAFYIEFDAEMRDEQEKIRENYMILREELNNIYKILTIKPIETFGQLFTLSMLKKHKEITL